MRILYAKSSWETPELSLAQFLGRCVEDGFDATELFLPAIREAPQDIAARHADRGLGLIAQIATAGDRPEDHATSLKERFEHARRSGALFVNCHTGRDIFPFDANLALFVLGERLAADAGLALRHELHRGRALFSAPAAARFLKALPGLTITADFSHWFCVHESDLGDQPDAVAAAVAAARHIHARVGFDQGPQVGDPRLERYRPWLERHVRLWQAIVAARRAAGDETLTITPEFGPFPYYPALSPGDAADAWPLNVWMRGHLRAVLQ